MSGIKKSLSKISCAAACLLTLSLWHCTEVPEYEKWRGYIENGEDGGGGSNIANVAGEAWVSLDGSIVDLIIFQADGKLLLAAPFGNDTWISYEYGTWSTSGNTLTINTCDGLTDTITYTVSDSILIWDEMGTHFTRMGGLSITNMGNLCDLWGTTYWLTINQSNGGTISSDWGTGIIEIGAGTSVTLTATPNSGYEFVEWTGDLSGTENPITVTVNNSMTISAIFQEEPPITLPTYTLTVNRNPTAGGTVTVNGVTSTGSTTHNEGASVTVTATAASGYTFSGWSGASMSTNASVTVIMNGNQTLTANFTQNPPASAPTVTATALSSSSIRVSWSTVSGATGYNLYRSGTAAGPFTILMQFTTPNTTSFENMSLSSNTTYYYQVSARNDGGEGPRSSAVSATTQPNITYGSFTDGRDGQVYGSVQIGGQTWMAENLNYEMADGNWCYDDNPANCATYGRLYTWDVAMSACPTGWHLPSRQEWDELVIAAGGTAGYSNYGAENLKDQSWDDGMNSLGFSALPGGSRYADGRFYYLGSDGYWWAATENGSSGAYYRSMYTGNARVGEYDYFKSNGFSVRCLQD